MKQVENISSFVFFCDKYNKYLSEIIFPIFSQKMNFDHIVNNFPRFKLVKSMLCAFWVNCLIAGFIWSGSTLDAFIHISYLGWHIFEVPFFIACFLTIVTKNVLQHIAISRIVLGMGASAVLQEIFQICYRSIVVFRSTSSTESWWTILIASFATALTVFVIYFQVQSIGAIRDMHVQEIQKLEDREPLADRIA